jgi:protoheme IX farnesyltransferase
LHLGLAALTFAAALVAAARTMREPAAPRSAARDYVTLTKPRIMSLLLLTGGCGYVIGAGGDPAPGRLALTLLGLAFACGGASALNHVLDRDIDRLMGARTRARPVAAERMPPSHALEFGLALSAASFVLLAGVVNLLTATLALVGNLFYVVVYTGVLKRRTPQNIVIGGAAGAVPPLVGWAAATGRLTLPALLLFAIVFLWTPPHFWALALLLKEHYAAARIPMLPVVAGDAETTRRIVRYTVALVAFTLVPVGLGFGPLYASAAALLGGVFVALALRLRARPAARPAAVLFHYSLVYLALLFVAAALDSVLA